MMSRRRGRWNGQIIALGVLERMLMNIFQDNTQATVELNEAHGTTNGLGHCTERFVSFVVDHLHEFKVDMKCTSSQFHLQTNERTNERTNE